MGGKRLDQITAEERQDILRSNVTSSPTSITVVDIGEEWAAFDRLPASVRKVLVEQPFQFPAVDILEELEMIRQEPMALFDKDWPNREIIRGILMNTQMGWEPYKELLRHPRRIQ